MAHLRGLANLGVELNPRYAGKWPLKIGSFILNFTNIELISFQYLDVLEATGAAFNKNLGLPLADRTGQIRRLVGASKKLTGPDKAEIELLWLEVEELAQWRNRIAHNPVAFFWNPGSDPDRDPTDLMGVLDMRQLEKGAVSDSISGEGMDKLIDASADLAQRLHAAAKKL